MRWARRHLHCYSICDFISTKYIFCQAGIIASILRPKQTKCQPSIWEYTIMPIPWRWGDGITRWTTPTTIRSRKTYSMACQHNTLTWPCHHSSRKWSYPCWNWNKKEITVYILTTAQAIDLCEQLIQNKLPDKEIMKQRQWHQPLQLKVTPCRVS